MLRMLLLVIALASFVFTGWVLYSEGWVGLIAAFERTNFVVPIVGVVAFLGILVLTFRRVYARREAHMISTELDALRSMKLPPEREADFSRDEDVESIRIARRFSPAGNSSHSSRLGIRNVLRGAKRSVDLTTTRLQQILERFGDYLPDADESRGVELRLHNSIENSYPDPNVDCSVFAPPAPTIGQAFHIQAIMHNLNDLFGAAKLAAERDKSSNRLAKASLELNLGIGQEVEFFLECPLAIIMQPLKSVTWSGEVDACVFDVTIPEGTDPKMVPGTVYVSANGIPIGEIDFILRPHPPLNAEPRAADTGLVSGFVDMNINDERAVPVGEESRRYRRAFISYSRKDFSDVSLFAQGLSENGIRLFIDLDALEPGDDWQEIIDAAIPLSDVFYLMWSSNAASSEWVLKETELAHTSSSSSEYKKPKIKPVQLHRGAPEPPDVVKGMHFDSVWLARREAQKKPIFENNQSE